MYFLCDVFWACKDVIEYVYEAIEWTSVDIFKDFSVYDFWTFVIKLLIFRYGFLNLFGDVVGCDFLGFVFSFFGDSS